MCTKCNENQGLIAEECDKTAESEASENSRWKSEEEYEYGMCPIKGCEGKLEMRWACPGYERDGKIWRCGSGCSNAQEFHCPECYWFWQNELHEKAYNYAENKANEAPFYIG